MMKKLSLAICYILISVTVLAQKSFTAKVRDAENDLPVAGATIEVESFYDNISDENGNFQLKLPPGSYKLKVSSIGYKPFDQFVDLKQEDIVIRLQRYNLFLQPVEIRATRAGDKAPFSKTNLSEAEIAKSNLGQDLPFLLNHTPSVVITSDAGNGLGYTGIRIRGTDATRINMTLNGIPYNDAESQGIFFVNLPDFASSLNSIQVQRGVGTSSNGAGAFGATLNLSTNTFHEDPYAEINNSVGSYGTMKHTIKLGTGLINKHFTVDARLSKISSDGFIDRASSNLNAYYVSGAYYSPSSSLRLNVFSGKEKTYQAWNGIPEYKLFYNKDSLLQHYYNNIGSLYFTSADSVNLFSAPAEKYNVFTYANQTDNYKQDHYQLLFNHSFNERISINSAAYLTRGIGYYEEFKNDAKLSSYGLPPFHVGNESITRTDLVRQLWLDNYLYGGIFSLQYKKKSSQASLGGAINEYDGKHYGYITWAAVGVPQNYRWYNFTSKKTDASVYGKWQQKITTHLDALLDVQYRQVHYNINGSRKFPDLLVNDQFHFFNPKIGFTYTAGNTIAYASYAIANKEPNRTDYETGSATSPPKPERLGDLEVGVENRNSTRSWGATLYFMNYKDQLVLVGKVNDVGDPVRINVPASYRLGLEMQGSYRLDKWIAVSGNLTLSRNEIKRFSDYVPRYDVNFDLVQQDTMYYDVTKMALSPEVVGSATLELFPFKNAEVALLNKYVSNQYLDNTSNARKQINDYFVSDLRATYSLYQWLAKEINITFQLNNVWNRGYQTNGYTYSYIYDKSTVTENFYYPMARRNFLVALNVRL